MYCKKCGNKLNDNDNFCTKCGVKNNIQLLQQITNDGQNNIVHSKDNIKPNFLLSNLGVFILFIVNTCLLFLGIMIDFFKEVADSSLGNGWFFIFFLILSLTCSAPSFLGTGLSAINLGVNNYIMLIFLFIISIISLIMTIYSSIIAVNNGVLFWICLILGAMLCMIILLKLIFKIKE